MGYIFLALAIASEVVATTFLKFTSGEGATFANRWWAYIIVVVGYILSFVMLSFTLSRGVPLGIAYAIWAGAGVVLVTLISWLVFKEFLTVVQLIGIALVFGGVLLLELGGKHE
ncbi:DMT family transporter [Subtercola boreus]|uniref:QacE family quaternary ammonium compound efflux SMR transporter n=1 Tax=Subtercola boreus TaxID=120213 RepID=A0A3E0W9H1_9MICO|nr:multidrug efflux SMR transporter [Subtercola boreus]RFA17996.1 QacE family quaternary ammonium compound efflux SMR transporter [Subtercola boreus]RFA18378.1 QacE family quaternary ammonium compound efflux SMR transporter [Subtercola boreus]RFA24907.1 QacE family quaternary ammonium compound efflux SMR transporter [Subtercola boreus]